jgi:hypothetical protein
MIGLALSALGSRRGLTYWTGDQAAELVSVEDFDRPGECEAAALAVSRSHGFAVCFGWVSAFEDGQEKAWGHCWNRDGSGSIVDAAKARVGPTGYLGVELEPADHDLIARFLPSPAVA